MIQISNLTKTYKVKVKDGHFRRKVKYIKAVDGLSMTIESGQIVGLLGINGAGKTTTIKILATLLTPDEGEIMIGGHDLKRDRFAIKSKINMITSGDRSLYWRLTGRENLQYFGRLYHLDEAILSERIETLTRQFGIYERIDESVEKYSKGMKQRLSIVRGLINNPQYLLMDEPTIGLDVNVARQLRTYVRDLAKKENKGILLTSHYTKDIEELCDYIYIIDYGRVIYEGKPSDVVNLIMNEGWQYSIQITDSSGDFTKNFDKICNQLEADCRIISNIDNITNVEVKCSKEIADDLFREFSKYGRIKHFAVTEPSLEDALIKLSEDVV